MSNRHSTTPVPDGTAGSTSARLTTAVDAVLREMLQRGTPVRMRVAATRLADGEFRVNARFDHEA